MNRLISLIFLLLIVFQAFSQKATGDSKSNDTLASAKLKIPTVPIPKNTTEEPNEGNQVLTQRIVSLESGQDYMFQTIDRQWNHFALISSLILGILGIGLPLVGFFTFKSHLSRTKEELAGFRSDLKNYEDNVAKAVDKMQKSHAYFRKEILESIGESAATQEYVLRRLPRTQSFDLANHLRSALKFSIKSISIFAQLFLEAKSEENRNSLMNMIHGCNATMDELFPLYDGNEYLLNDIRKSFVKYDFEFVHDLRKYFKTEGNVQTLNAFEANLRRFRLYGWPDPIEW